MTVPALVQAVASKDATNQTNHVTGTLGATPTPGNLLVLAVMFNINGGNINAFTDTPFANLAFEIDDVMFENWTVICTYKIAGGSETTSYTTHSSGHPCIAGQKLMEFSGIDQTTPLRTTATGTNASSQTSGSCGSITPITGELLLAVGGSNADGSGGVDGSGSAINNSYSLIAAGFPTYVATGYRLAPNVTPINPAISWTPNTASFIGGHIAFNAAPNPASDRQIPRGLFRGLTRGVS